MCLSLAVRTRAIYNYLARALFTTTHENIPIHNPMQRNSKGCEARLIEGGRERGSERNSIPAIHAPPTKRCRVSFYYGGCDRATFVSRWPRVHLDVHLYFIMDLYDCYCGWLFFRFQKVITRGPPRLWLRYTSVRVQRAFFD